MNVFSIALNLLGASIFIFIFWKKLKEDFGSDAIFTSAFYILIGILLSFLVSHSFFRDLWFWIGFVGVVFGFGLSYYRFKLKTHETIEAVVIGFLPWLFITFVYGSFVDKNLGNAIYTALIGLLILVYLLLDKHYKKFSWYKSGRVGFSGLTVLGLFFSLRAIVALVTPSVLSFVGNVDAIVSGILAFLFFVMVFNLAQKTTY